MLAMISVMSERYRRAESPPYQLDQANCQFDYQHIFFLFCALSLISGIYKILKRKPNRDRYPPGPTPWPFVGSVEVLSQTAHIKLSNAKDTYGDVFAIKIGSHDAVVACSYDAIIEGLEHESFVDRPECCAYDALYCGDRNKGISTADFTELTYSKRTFITDVLDGKYANPEAIELNIILEIADSLIAVSKMRDKPFNPLDIFNPSILNISFGITFDKHLNTDDIHFIETLKTFEMRTKFSNYWLQDNPVSKYFFENKTKNIMEQTLLQTDFQTQIMDQHKDRFDPLNVRDLVDILLMHIDNNDDKGLLDKDDIISLVLDITSSGFSATVATLHWLILFMACNPDVQTRVQDELDSYLGASSSPILADQAHLPYTVATILEAERLATVYPLLLPHKSRNNSVYQGYEIPEGSWLLLNVWSLHHDPRYWKNPMMFDPQRFLSQTDDVEVPEYFLPYGAGARQCPGESLAEAEIFLFFSYFMQQFHFKLPDGVSEPNTEGVYDGILRANEYLVCAYDRKGLALQVMD